jgi:CheY-like chemotaxis protein
VVNDILDFSKIEEGKLDIEHVYFDLEALFERCVRSFHYEACQKGISVLPRVNNNIGGHEVQGDPTRIRQVMVNLIGNAIKFTSKGRVEPTLNIEGIDEESVSVTFEVLDTGAGIPQDKLDTIFEAFAQADGSNSRRHGGTGLGLAISKQLADLMKGKISVTSMLDQGSTFTFQLSLPFRGIASNQGVDRSASATPRLSGRVLLVEDNPVNQLVTVGLLKSLGLDAEVASDGQEGVKKVAMQRYDLVLMDCQMPNMDGFAATRIIRAQYYSSESELPIIALTANAMKDDREQCLQSGMNDYLSKPVRKELLAETIRHWLPVKSQSP